MNHRRSTCNRLFTLSFSSSFFFPGERGIKRSGRVWAALSSFFTSVALFCLAVIDGVAHIHTHTHTHSLSLCTCAVLACSSLLLPFSCAGVRCFSFLFFALFYLRVVLIGLCLLMLGTWEPYCYARVFFASYVLSFSGRPERVGVRGCVYRVELAFCDAHASASHALTPTRSPLLFPSPPEKQT